MPSELQRVAQELLATIERIPDMTAALQRLAHRCREQAAHIGGADSSNPAARIAALQLDAAASACEEAAHYAAQVPPKVTGWVQAMVSGRRGAVGNSPAPDVRTIDGRAASRSMEPDHRRPALPAESVRRTLNRLPDRNAREKTRGSWTDKDGQEFPLVSGKGDQYHKAADEHAAKLGIGPLMTTSHVEIKFAMFMRERGLKNESIVINNVPCGEGRWSCEELLKEFLPEDAQLTIYAPDFQRTYPIDPTDPIGPTDKES